MRDKITLRKCWNCGKWGYFEHSPECSCGVHVYEDGEHDVESVMLDLNDAANVLRGTNCAPVVGEAKTYDWEIIVDKIGMCDVRYKGEAVPCVEFAVSIEPGAGVALAHMTIIPRSMRIKTGDSQVAVTELVNVISPSMTWWQRALLRVVSLLWKIPRGDSPFVLAAPGGTNE